METLKFEDIAAIEAEYERVHGLTPAILPLETLGDLDQHQNSLDNVLNALDLLETYYDGIVKKYQNLRDSVKDKKKALERDHDACKRRYWLLRNAGDRTGQKPA
jgi:hypothetical protein